MAYRCKEYPSIECDGCGMCYKEAEVEDDYITRRCCGTCRWHDNYTWVCSCPDSDYRADFTDSNHVCVNYEEE